LQKLTDRTKAYNEQKQRADAEKELNESLISVLGNAIGWLLNAGDEEKARKVSESARAHIMRLRGEAEL
ncbi:hypothetical protein, partial [Paenibacillus apiarius]|uniref:hypothetical protein n=1 Tax=Paenibacillus apiarius TaxID=46240 RepID=UPI003B3AA81E